jgi:hypothetical protein
MKAEIGPHTLFLDLAIDIHVASVRTVLCSRNCIVTELGNTHFRC